MQCNVRFGFSSFADPELFKLSWCTLQHRLLFAKISVSSFLSLGTAMPVLVILVCFSCHCQDLQKKLQADGPSDVHSFLHEDRGHDVKMGSSSV